MKDTGNSHQYQDFTWEELDAHHNATLALIQPMEADEVASWYVREGEAMSGVWDHLCGAFDKLIEVNPAHAQAIFVNLAQREDPQERWYGAFNIIYLTPLDHDVGMHFWERFMQDPDPKIRDCAYWTLEERVSASSLDRQGVEDFQELGITWQDACNLYRAYIGRSEARLYRGLGDSALGQASAQAPDQ